MPEGTVGLILGRSSITTKGILFQPGVIDSDYQGEIKISMSTFGYHVIPAQTRIAQLLPYTVRDTQNIKRGEGGFGSTNNQSIFWSTSIKLNKPF